MDLTNDERLKLLYDQIQQEKDPAKLVALTRELLRLIDDGSDGKSSDNRV